jgi:hypothetical protein
MWKNNGAMGTVVADLRYAIRRLLNAPAFALFTVVLLAVAIGANTAIFSLLDALSLRALPVRHPEQLVQVAIATSRPDSPTRDGSVSVFREMSRRQQVFSTVIGFAANYPANVEIDGERSRVNTWFVTGNFYEALGTRPLAGRLLSPEDDGVGRFVPAVVLGYDY